MSSRLVAAALAAFTLAAAGPALAQTRVTLKSATSSSSYYVMVVQIGEALKEASGGTIQATIEESQGSVQNVKESARRPGNFIFTTPPNLQHAVALGLTGALDPELSETQLADLCSSGCTTT